MHRPSTEEKYNFSKSHSFKGGIHMIYKTIVIDYAPKAKKMAAAVEEKANEMAQNGWELVTLSVTNSAKAILVFCSQKGIQNDN